MKLQGLGYNNCTLVYPLEYKTLTYLTLKWPILTQLNKVQIQNCDMQSVI